jgi:hypothetical protein
MDWGRRRDSHSRGAKCPAVYESAAVCKHLSLLSHVGMKMVGCHGAAPFDVRKHLCV